MSPRPHPPSPRLGPDNRPDRGLDAKSRPNAPRPAWVKTDAGGRPAQLNNRPVEQIAEEWLVSDRWWTPRPLRRHYYELVLTDGANQTVYRDTPTDRWFTQRA